MPYLVCKKRIVGTGEILYLVCSVVQIRRGNRDKLGIIFLIAS